MSAERAALLVFAKAPRAGRVKTRLAPHLGAEGAARLYRAFLEDVWARARSLEAFDAELWAASEEDAAHLAPRRCRVQRGGDLGERMSAAMEDALGRARRVVLIGSDAPTLPPALLGEALRALDRAEVVFGPSADGGFYLVGARGEAARFGSGVRWSTRHALDDARAAQGGRPARLLPPWYDIDTEEDLQVLRAHLALAPGAAPRTSRALASF